MQTHKHKFCYELFMAKKKEVLLMLLYTRLIVKFHLIPTFLV